MNLTNADTAKRLLIDLLVAETGSGESLDGVQIEYADPATQLRECVFPGPVTFTNPGNDDQEIRLETATIPLVVRVVDPSRTPRDNDQRTIAIAAAIGTIVTANQHPLGATSWWAVNAGELAGIRTDDEAISVLTLQIEVRSYL